MKTIYDKNKAPIKTPSDMDRRVLRAIIVILIIAIAIWNCPLPW